MAKNRKEAWDEYHRTGKNTSSYDLNDYDEIAAITGWNCARNQERSEAFREYHRTGRNSSNYDLNDRDRMQSIIGSYPKNKKR